MLFDLQKIWNFFPRKTLACSHLNLQATPLLEIYRCMNLIAVSAVVFETTFAAGNFDHLSIATRM